jgi:hypothetical protein
VSRPGTNGVLLAISSNSCGRPKLATNSIAPSRGRLTANRSASHNRAANLTSVSSTACRSKLERLMTLSTSPVAVCCSRASFNSRVSRATSVPLGEDQYQQEFECSFEAAIKGAFYAEEMRTMLAEGRICPIEINKDVRTHTAWDLGVSDSTAIWFIQCIGPERRLVDYYESSGVGLDHYAQVLHDKRIDPLMRSTRSSDSLGGFASNGSE